MSQNPPEPPLPDSDPFGDFINHEMDFGVDKPRPSAFGGFGQALPPRPSSFPPFDFDDDDDDDDVILDDGDTDQINSNPFSSPPKRLQPPQSPFGKTPFGGLPGSSSGKSPFGKTPFGGSSSSSSSKSSFSKTPFGGLPGSSSGKSPFGSPFGRSPQPVTPPPPKGFSLLKAFDRDVMSLRLRWSLFDFLFMFALAVLFLLSLYYIETLPAANNLQATVEAQATQIYELQATLSATAQP